jgi:hypothetical protein
MILQCQCSRMYRYVYLQFYMGDLNNSIVPSQLNLKLTAAEQLPLYESKVLPETPVLPGAPVPSGFHQNECTSHMWRYMTLHHLPSFLPDLKVSVCQIF